MSRADSKKRRPCGSDKKKRSRPAQKLLEKIARKPGIHDKDTRKRKKTRMPLYY